MYPVRGLELLDFIVYDIHTCAMAFFGGVLHIEIYERICLRHLRPINLSGIVIYTEKVVDLVQICPRMQYGVHGLLKEIKPFTCGHGEEHTDWGCLRCG
jgi:hypothetical protein